MERRVNLAAVIVAAIVHWLLGAAWFTVFAKPWIAGLGYTEEQVKQIAATMGPAPYILVLAFNIGVAYVLARVIIGMNSQTAACGAGLGFMLGFGLAALPMLTEIVFERRPTSFALIAAGYPVIGMMIMGAILGAWKGKQKAPIAAGAGA